MYIHAHIRTYLHIYIYIYIYISHVRMYNNIYLYIFITVLKTGCGIYHTALIDNYTQLGCFVIWLPQVISHRWVWLRTDWPTKQAVSSRNEGEIYIYTHLYINFKWYNVVLCLKTWRKHAKTMMPTVNSRPYFLRQECPSSGRKRT